MLCGFQYSNIEQESWHLFVAFMKLYHQTWLYGTLDEKTFGFASNSSEIPNRI